MQMKHLECADLYPLPNKGGVVMMLDDPRQSCYAAGLEKKGLWTRSIWPPACAALEIGRIFTY